MCLATHINPTKMIIGDGEYSSAAENIFGGNVVLYCNNKATIHTTMLNYWL